MVLLLINLFSKGQFMSTDATSMTALSSVFADVSYEASQKTSSKEGTSSLDQEDFLKLLTTQLEHQDPMDPMDDTDFIAQMANFTSLEQTKEMSTTLSNMAVTQQTIGLTNYLGKTVTINDGDKTVTGEVEAITADENGLYVMVDGKEYLPTTISAIAQSLTTQTQE